MKHLSRLLWMAIKKELLIMRSYGFNTVIQFLTLAILFAMIYFGAKVLVGQKSTFGNTTTALILGYWIWMGILMSFSQFAWSIITYAEQGLLEQLFMTPWQLKRIIAVEAAGDFLISTTLNLLMLLLFMLITGRWLRLEPLTTATLYVLILLPGYGIGYALAGLAMRFKNIQAIFNITQFAIVIFEALPVNTHPWMKIFPFAPGLRMLIQHVQKGTLLWQFSAQDLAVLIAQSVVYLALGLFIYSQLEDAARERGLLAHY